MKFIRNLTIYNKLKNYNHNKLYYIIITCQITEAKNSHSNKSFQCDVDQSYLVPIVFLWPKLHDHNCHHICHSHFPLNPCIWPFSILMIMSFEEKRWSHYIIFNKKKIHCTIIAPKFSPAKLIFLIFHGEMIIEFHSIIHFFNENTSLFSVLNTVGYPINPSIKTELWKSHKNMEHQDYIYLNHFIFWLFQGKF